MLIRIPRLLWLWLKYLRGPEAPLGLRDLLLVVAHVSGSALLALHLSLYLEQLDVATTTHGTLVALALILWGSAWALHGIVFDDRLARFAGIAITFVPMALVFPTENFDRDADLAGFLLLMAGAAVLVLGALSRQRIVRD